MFDAYLGDPAGTEVIRAESGEWMASGKPLPAVTAFAVGAAALAFHLLSFRWLRAPRWKNKSEARQELQRLMSEHDHLPYEMWAARIGQTKRVEFTTESGTWYQSTIEPVWDDEPAEVIRVLFAIDDGNVGAYHPLTGSLLVRSPTQ